MSKKLFYAISVMVAALVVAVVSCKKDNETQKFETLINASEEIDNMDEYLISFKEKLLSAQKGEEFIGLEQARLDLGNLLNFKFGDANYATNVIQYDTLHTKVVISEGQVDLSQLAVTYKDACELIKKAYEQVSLPEKSVYTIYCTFDQESRNGEMVDVQLVLTTRGFDFALKDICSVSPTKSSIDETDCWKVARGDGRCDGTDVGFDHVRILRLVYLNNISPLECFNGRIYYTNQGMYDFDALDFPETGTQFYNYGFRLWAGNYNDWCQDTIPADEMSYYYNNLCDIIDTHMASLNNNQLRVYSISCNAQQDQIAQWWYRFDCSCEYGKPNCTGLFDD